MQKWLRGLLLVGTLVLASLVGTVPVVAATQAAGANDIGFSVAAHIPNNQLNQKNSFFDLKMVKNQTERLQTTIYNMTSRDIQVQMAIHTAYTNSNATIEYVKPASVFDPSLKYPISALTKIVGPSTVTIPANGSKVVQADVKMPATQINGVLLGGWYFKRVDHPVTGTVKGTTNMQNQYSYVIGLRYTSGKVPQPVMRLKSVQAGLYNYHRGIIVALRNIAAIMVPNATTQTVITNLDDHELVKNVKQTNVQIAPNTLFKYPLLLGDTALQAGRYHLHMVVRNAQHRWVFNRNFTITKAEAQKYNQAAVDHKGLSFWFVLALGALSMLLLMLLLWLIIMLIRKRKQHSQAEK